MSTSSYIVVPIETDPNTLSLEALQYLMTIAPGWTPHEGNIEVWILEIVARLEAETRDVASRVTKEIFRYFGKSLLNIPAIDGSPATATSTWTMRDATGYTIPAGAVVAYQPSGTSQAYFRVVNSVVVPPGNIQTGTGEVLLSAVVSGSSGNGLAAGQVALVDSLSFVSSASAETVTAGGVDPETDDAYLDRLRGELKLLAPRPILPRDFATMARNQAGVARSVAIDGYNPTDGTTDNERMVAVALADASGNPVTDDIKSTVRAYLESLREVNFVVNVVDADYTTVDVNASVKVLDGFDASTVVTAATQAVTAFLQPSAWPWENTLRYNQLVALIAGVPGVEYVAAITTPSDDLTLGTVASLVRAGAISITAVDN